MTRENYRTQMRAVFLAAIMVISMVGMSVAFTGAAAAIDDDPSPEFTDGDNGELDITGDEAQTQQLTFNVTEDSLSD